MVWESITFYHSIIQSSYHTVQNFDRTKYRWVLVLTIFPYKFFILLSAIFYFVKFAWASYFNGLIKFFLVPICLYSPCQNFAPYIAIYTYWIAFDFEQLSNDLAYSLWLNFSCTCIDSVYSNQYKGALQPCTVINDTVKFCALNSMHIRSYVYVHQQLTMVDDIPNHWP